MTCLHDHDLLERHSQLAKEARTLTPTSILTPLVTHSFSVILIY
jgi:hypothetical protein